MVKNTLKHTALIAYFFLMSFPLSASAECSTPTVQGRVYQNPIAESLGICGIPDLLLALVDLVLLISVPIVVIFIIYGGFLFVKSGDNESEVTKAKKVLTWTIVGALVLLGAKAIRMAIQSTVLSLGT